MLAWNTQSGEQAEITTLFTLTTQYGCMKGVALMVGHVVFLRAVRYPEQVMLFQRESLVV